MTHAFSNPLVSQVAPPATPNEVSINYIEVTRNTDTPYLTSRLVESDNGTKLEYFITMFTLNIVYDARACGSGIGLLMGRYENDEEVYVIQVCNYPCNPDTGNVL